MTASMAIITAVKNHPQGLQRTAASLEKIRTVQIYWYIADGGSVGDLPIKWSGLSPRWAESRADAGVYDGMNRALDALEHDVRAGLNIKAVMFINAGDSIENPDAPALLLSTGTFAYGDTVTSDAQGRLWLWPARPSWWLAWGMPAYHQAMLYPLASIQGLRFDLGYPIGADYAFTLRAAQRARPHRLRIPVCRFEGGGISHRQPAQGRRDQRAIRIHFLHWPRWLVWAISALQWVSWALRSGGWPLFQQIRRLRRLVRRS